MRLLRPAETVSSILEIDYAGLWEAGKRVLIFDLDKTLGPRRAPRLSPQVTALLGDLSARGFRIAVLTNRRRVKGDPVIAGLSRRYPVIHRARKPSKRGFQALLDRLDARVEEAVVIGDRLLTDVLGANRIGILAIRVRST